MKDAQNFNKLNRSSVIFPVYKTGKTYSYISFLTYWVKKHQADVTMILTLRDLAGNQLAKKKIPINEYKAVVQSLVHPEFNAEDGFCGSAEIEIYSDTEPLYKFPAISLFYNDEINSSVVHSCIRTYNENEIPTDYAIDYPQTGFDVKVREGVKNFIIFFGSKRQKYRIQITIECGGFSASETIFFKNNNYGQCHIIYLEDLSISYQNMVVSKVSISHDLDVFPRFYVGSIEAGSCPTLTHTFFDTSNHYAKEDKSTSASIYSFNVNATKYFDAAFIIPVFPPLLYETSLRTYAQNMQFNGEIYLKCFDSDQQLVKTATLTGEQAESFNDVGALKVSELLMQWNLVANEFNYLFMGFRASDNRFPNRFKLGLNVRENQSLLGANICFAPSVQFRNMFEKPFSRRWFPLGGDSNYVAFFHLTSLERVPNHAGIKVTLEFVNCWGDVMTKVVVMNVNGSLRLNIEEDPELSLFYREKLGWCYITAEHYLVDSYFFSAKGSQVGGDHAF